MSTLKDLLSLPRMVLPYVLHPLTALEIFLPHAGLTSWITQPNVFKPESDIPSLRGKVILVTGGNGGLGLETIYQLALHEPEKIYLAARSETRARNAIKQVEERLRGQGRNSASNIHWLMLDLADFDSVRRAAHVVLESEQHLDILVLNAGMMAMSPSKTYSGYDLQLATNYMGHFLLVQLLIPLLERTASSEAESDVRVISVASEAYHLAPPNFIELIESHEELCSSSDYTRYGVSKAANIMFAAEVARRYGTKKIRSVSLHPGLILTDLFSPARDANFFVRYGLPPVARIMFDDKQRGALNTLWCAAGANADIIQNGQYYTPVGKLRRIALAEDKDMAKRLWMWTEEQLKPWIR